MKPYVLLMDGDWLVYRAMAAHEVETDWGDDNWTLICDHGLAWSSLLSSIEAFKKKRKAWADADVVLCFTDSENWRKGVLPTYKENRKGTRKPTGYRQFLERVFACEDWKCFLRPTLEGDDCMGILGTKPSLVGVERAVLISCDKDFKTIPDCDFYWATEGKILSHTKEEADYWHWYQALIGDATDGYAGVKSMGPDLAVKWLEDPWYFEQETTIIKRGKNAGTERTQWITKRLADNPSMSRYEAIVNVGVRNGMTPEEVLAQFRVARICRYEDYNLKTKEVKLWMP